MKRVCHMNITYILKRIVERMHGVDGRRTALAGEAGGVLRGAADMRCRSALRLLPFRDFG